MNTRHLFLIGYDITQNPRRRRVLRDVQHHALGGQKSFYECWLSVGELQTLLAQMRSRIDTESDRVVFVRLDARSQSVQLGQAEAIASADYFHIA
ncbi:MAG: CRISPR-associated endonuclease Cas2 [Hydrogenophaga sp.]|jgi:CRISPR-associated protein Cas2|nr:CRISPR-associated endonuclease Cas2 [Hydrogenophaga sp.]